MITLGQLTDFTDDELAKLQAASMKVNAALADPKFLAILAAAQFDNTSDANALIILNLCKPILITRLYCEYLGWWATHVSGTVAEESQGGVVTFNRAFFDDQAINSLANTEFHEACHVAGYSHRSAQDVMSVPYQAGNLLESYLNGN